MDLSSEHAHGVTNASFVFRIRADAPYKKPNEEINFVIVEIHKILL